MSDKDPQSTAPKKQGPNPLLETTSLSLGILIVTALFLMVNYLGMRHYKRWDWTSAQLYTLSEKSKQVVKDLDHDVDIVVLLNPASELYTAVSELLDRFVAENPGRITRRDLDAAKDLLELQQLVDQYDIQRDNVIVVAGAGDKRIIGEHELAEYDYSGAQFGQPPTMKAFKGEGLITSAILSLVEAEKPKLVFTTGHGEARFDPSDPRSLSQARDLLGGDNFEIEEWSSLGASAVPEDADLLVIAGPTTNFLPPELEIFDAYLRDGGRILLFADPAFQPGSTAAADLGLTDWLRGWGVEIQSDIVVDPTSELPFFGPETLFTDRYGAHPIVESLDQTRTRVLLPLTRSVAAADESPADVFVTELVTTSEEGWAETDLENLTAVALDDNDVPGPVPVAVALTLDRGSDDDSSELAGDDETSATDGSESETAQAEASQADGSREARMVVFGDLDFAADAQISNGANSLLLLNAFNWLVEREQLIDIEGKVPTQTRLSIDGSELMGLYAIFVLLMPALAVAAGLWIALQRRR